VDCTGLVALLRKRNRGYHLRTFVSDREDKKCIQKFGEETSWKAAARKT
jgi:hypothetical protein